MLLFNANPHPGKTTYAILLFGENDLVKSMCGVIEPLETQRIEFVSTSPGANGEGSVIVQALESTQPAGPGLAATVVTRAQPAPQ